MQSPYLHNGGPTNQRVSAIIPTAFQYTPGTTVSYQKCTVFRPTGLFHMRWKVLCCWAASAPASELWKRKPWAPGRRNGAEALRKAKRVLLRKRKPTRDDMVIRCGGDEVLGLGRRAGSDDRGSQVFRRGKHVDVFTTTTRNSSYSKK